MKKILIPTSSTILVSQLMAPGGPPGFEPAELSPISTYFVAPTRVIWQSWMPTVQDANSL